MFSLVYIIMLDVSHPLTQLIDRFRYIIDFWCMDIQVIFAHKLFGMNDHAMPARSSRQKVEQKYGGGD